MTGKGFMKNCESCGEKFPQRSKTRIDKFCITCKKQIGIEKRKATCLRKFGCENIAQSKQAQEKWVATKKQKYGYAGFFQEPRSQEVVQKAAHSEQAMAKKIETCRERYGVDHHAQTEEYIKNKQDCYEVKTGYRNPMQNPDVIKNRPNRNYFYDGYYFDSSWEIAYYVYLKDQKKSFIYHPSEMYMEYVDEVGVTRHYYPDFLVEGQFVELKGDQFFNEKGEPYNNYYKTFWWNKYNAMKQHNVVILRFSDIKPFVKYVKDAYGSNFLNDCKISKKEKRLTK